MIGWSRRRACRSHQAALVDFATHRAGGPDVRRALDHVDRCRPCEADLAATALVLHALYRLHEETSGVELAPDGWARMRARLVTTRTRREPSLLMSSLPGVALAVMLIIAVGDLPVLRGTQVIIDDGSANVLRHTSIDDAQLVARGPEARPVTRVIARPILRAQDRARPATLVAGPQAVDAGTTSVEPVVAPPAAAPRDAPSSDAQMSWR